MKLSQDTNLATGAASASLVCKRLLDNGFHSADFSIFSLADLSKETLEQRAVGGIMVGVICGGTVRAVINSQRLDLHRNNLLLLSDDSEIESFKCSKACSGYLLVFSRRFLEGIDLSVRDVIAGRVMFRTTPSVVITAYDAMRLHNIAIALSDAIVEDDRYMYDEKIYTSLFSAYFYTLASVLSAGQGSSNAERSISRGEELMRQFMQLLDEMCCEQRSVEYYASRMGITSKYLSLICKTQTGQSALKVIDEVVIRKAKELLGQSGVSVQQVAEQLNFVSQSFFGKYFKQRVGMSPSRYKAQH